MQGDIWKKHSWAASKKLISKISIAELKGWVSTFTFVRVMQEQIAHTTRKSESHYATPLTAHNFLGAIVPSICNVFLYSTSMTAWYRIIFFEENFYTDYLHHLHCKRDGELLHWHGTVISDVNFCMHISRGSMIKYMSFGGLGGSSYGILSGTTIQRLYLRMSYVCQLLLSFLRIRHHLIVNDIWNRGIM